MKISIEDLTTDRQWRSATGSTEPEFRRLLQIFESIYVKTQGEAMEEKQARCLGESVIKTYEDLLFFTLFSLKAGLTYDNLGLVTGMDGSNAKRNQNFGLGILKATLLQAGVAPKRDFKSVEEFQAHFADTDTLILDGTEQRIERPQDPVTQKENYSGKKKLTPLKRSLSRVKTR